MVTPVFSLNSRIYSYSHTVGRAEYRGEGFRNPVDLALAKSGAMYVLNRSFEERTDGIRVTICTVEEELISEFGRRGQGDGEFIWPTSIALDSEDNVYVSDEWTNRISVFDGKGRFLNQWGTKGSGAGEFDRPSGLAFNSSNELHVVDMANHRIQKFDQKGKFLAAFGGRGMGDGQFNSPWGITVDTNGDLYVADWRNDRIQKFTPEGKFLEKFGASGDAVGQFNRPSGVAVDRDGEIYVADWGNHRVQVFAPSWRHITTFSGDATLSKWGVPKLESNPSQVLQLQVLRDKTAWRGFWFPVAVDVDDRGRVLVVDGARHRIQVYQKLGVPVASG